MADENDVSDTMSTPSEESEFEMDFDAPSEYDFQDCIDGERHTEELVDWFDTWLINFRLRNEHIDPHISYDDFRAQFRDRCPADMDDGDVWWYWTFREWDCHDAKFKVHESAYLHPEKHPQIGLGVESRYDYRTPAELKRFVVQRGLPDPYPAGVTLKTSYIRLLDKADRDSHFRLMDLPAEMRLIIYRELLLFPAEGRKKCDPTILLASREVYEEAKGVLYDDNVMTCEFKVIADGTYNAKRSVRVHNKTHQGGCDHGLYVRMPDGIDDYPEFLHRISRLQIEVIYEIEPDKESNMDSYMPLNHYLYTLASFLMDDHRLRELRINVNFAPIESHGFGSVFLPLRRLRNVKKVIVSGYLPARFKRRIIGDMTSSEPMFNTMREWKFLQDEAVMQLSLLELVSPEACECGCNPMPSQYDDIDTQLQILMQHKLECCLSSTLEEHFMAHLAVLRDILNRVDIEQMEKVFKQIHAKRSALKEYEAGTDGGRLDEAAEIWAEDMDNEGAKYADGEEDWSGSESDDDAKDELAHKNASDDLDAKNVVTAGIAGSATPPSPEL